VYRGDLKAERNFINFALFVSFFPQLVAGPIERATNLLPQVTKERIITKENLKQGAFLVLFGYFKKVYVADNLATIVDPVFNSNHNNPLVQVVDPSGAMVLIACIAFSFQIYADFAGYSEIARGIAKFMGFELMRNFNHPVFSVNPAELWKRWHISLMSWFKDYIYRPLGTDNDSKFVQHRNNLVVFFVSGLWHGANWTFVMWGVYSGVLLTIYRIVKPFLPKPKEESSRIIYIVKFIIKCSLVYGSFALSAVFFRAQNISESFHYLHNVIFQFGNLVPNVSEKLFRYIIILLAVEAYQFYKNDEFAFFKSPVWVRTFLYVLLFECILILGNCNNNEFIYFVF
jgi:D-alanyl-lipoteichoic acid acyltransferase DltB (MBOAT superfamily)